MEEETIMCKDCDFVDISKVCKRCEHESWKKYEYLEPLEAEGKS